MSLKRQVADRITELYNTLDVVCELEGDIESSINRKIRDELKAVEDYEEELHANA